MVGYSGKPYPHVARGGGGSGHRRDPRRRRHRRAAGGRARRVRRLLPRPRRHRGRRSPAAGCAPATWWNATPTATSGWWTGSRTSTSPAARTWPRPRSRPCLLAHPRRGAGRRRRVSRTSAGAKAGVAFVVVRPGHGHRRAGAAGALRRPAGPPSRSPARIEMVGALPRTALNKVLARAAAARNWRGGGTGRRPGHAGDEGSRA